MAWAVVGRPFGARQWITPCPRSLQEWERPESAVRTCLTVMDRNPEAVEKALT
jgi:hypothetical protein